MNSRWARISHIIADKIFRGRLDLAEGNPGLKNLTRFLGAIRSEDVSRLMRFLKAGIRWDRPWNPYTDDRWDYKLYLAMIPAEDWHDPEINPDFHDINLTRTGWLRISIFHGRYAYARLIDSEGVFDSGWWAPGPTSAWERAREVVFTAIFLARPNYFPNWAKRKCVSALLFLDTLKGEDGKRWLMTWIINRTAFKMAKFTPLWAEPSYLHIESNINVQRAIDLFENNERKRHIDQNQSEKEAVVRKRIRKRTEFMEQF